MKILKLSSLYLLSLAQTTFTYAQDDVCSCSPSIYKWTLDFSSSCSYTGFPDPDGSIGIEIGPDEGVRDASCQITMENQLTSEAFMTPVKVTGYQIIEQDASATALKTVSESDLELTDGAQIVYNSFTGMAGLDVEDYPFFLFVIVFAENANGEEIQLETLVKFSGTCALEVFGNGDTIGWLKFVSNVCICARSRSRETSEKKRLQNTLYAMEYVLCKDVILLCSIFNFALGFTSNVE